MPCAADGRVCYKSEEIAKKVIWVMGQNKVPGVFRPEYCHECKTYHIKRVDSGRDRTGGPDKREEIPERDGKSRAAGE